MKRHVATRVRLFFVVLFAATAAGAPLAAPLSRLPSGWSTRDIGRVGAWGSAVAGRRAFVLTGSGVGVTGAADSFRFAYRELTGDGEIVAQVGSLTPVDAWTSAGIMMRESLSANARHAYVSIAAGTGLGFDRRGSTAVASMRAGAAVVNTGDATRAQPRSGGAIRRRVPSAGSTARTTTARSAVARPMSTGDASLHTAAGGAGGAYLIRLVRSGHTFSASTSEDGSMWTPVGTDTIPMRTTIYVGLAVSSHQAGTVATGTFLNVRIAGAGDGASAGTVGRSDPAATPASAGPVAPAPVAPAPSAPAPSPPAPSAPAPVAPAPVAPSSPPSGGTGGATTVRLLHWNIHHGGIGTDGLFDPDRVAAWVAQMNPDIISFNEVDDAAQAALLHGLVSAYTGSTWTTTFSGWGNQLLTRLPVTATSVCTFNQAAGRRAAHMSTVVNGRAINIWSAHLAVDSASDRAYEVSALQRCARDWSEARIIAGDHNMQQNSGEYYAATASYTDAWAAARSIGATINYAGNCDGCTRNSRIDYVFTSLGAPFLTMVSAQIYDTRDRHGYMPSDHKPMVVTYTVQ